MQAVSAKPAGTLQSMTGDVVDPSNVCTHDQLLNMSSEGDASKIEALSAKLGDKTAAARRQAAFELESLGDTGAAALAKQLEATDPTCRRTAAEALVRMGNSAVPHADALANCLNRLGEEDAFLRAEALRAFQRFDVSLILLHQQVLFSRLSDKKERALVRGLAARVLARLEGGAARFVDQVASWLDDPDIDERKRARELLASMGDVGRDALALKDVHGQRWVRTQLWA